jgi:hypothetical protein
VPNFIYRCPKTGYNVQGNVAAGDFEGQMYVGQMCLACNSLHLVDPLTGKLATEDKRGDDRDRK